MPKNESLPFGERLKEMREEAGMSIEQLADKTKIQRKYLELLEAEDLHTLPPPVYIRGFVQRWAKACGSDIGEALMHFDRMQAIFMRDVPRDRPLGHFSRHSFVITLPHIVITIGSLVLLVILSYFVYQYIFFMRSPLVEIYFPNSMESVLREQWVIIEGTGQRMKSLTVAGQEVYLEEDGYFRKEVALNEGLNVVRIEGIGQNGQRVEMIRKVTRVP
jgi:transcriptional regulator with XRE-family HTH domain